MESGDTVRAVRVAGKAGRRTRTDSPAGAVAYAYCPWNGLVSSVALPGGVTASYAYDMMDRVTNVAWRTASGGRLGGFDYAYDAIGRVVSRRHDLGGSRFDRAYGYDAADRLASDGGVAYTYDAAGNRLSRTGDGAAVAYAYGPGDRLAAWTGGSYAHDAAGCVTRIVRGGVVMDLAWDGLRRLVSVATNGVPAESYAYDALGRRTATTAAGGTERHVYDDRRQVIADLDADGRVVRSYLWGEGIDRLLAVRIGPRTYAALADAQGTVWGFADEGGRIAARWTYDAWGNVLSEEIAEGAGELRAVRYRFQGRELSAATGLIHFRARWYDPMTGRWLSPDPIGLEGGLNLHAFCGNDPVNYTDPSGLCVENGDEILGNIRLFYDAIDTLGKTKRFAQYVALFSLSGGPWGPLDFKAKGKGPFMVKGSIVAGDYFGNYVAGYQAGYADGMSNTGLLTGVYLGGIFWSIISTESPGDLESRPAIDHGYFDGVQDRHSR